MAFDGDSDYFSTADSGDWDLGGDFTVECWFKTNATAEQSIIGTEVTHTNDDRWAFWINSSNELGFFIRGEATSAQGSTVLSTNTWYHLAAVRSGSTITLYVNGSSDGSFTSSTALVADGLVLGCWYTGGTSSFVNGFVDSLRISKKARTISASTTALTDDINTVLLLNADVNQGTWAEDQSTGLAISTDSRMKFDGTDDSLSVPDSSDWEFGSGDFCIEAWVNVNENTSTHTIWSTTNVDDNGGMFCNVGAAVGLYWYIGTGSGHIVLTAPALSAGRWYHVACVRSGTGSNETIIYVDGVSAATGTYTDDSQDAGANGFYVGDWPPNSWDLNGYVDEVRVSNVERYSGTFTPKGRGEAFEADANTKLLIHSDYTGGLGADSSGNYNAFAVTNLDANDQMIDTPTNNFATLNPLNNRGTLTEGNLDIDITTSNLFGSSSTIAENSGKWYAEFYLGAFSSSAVFMPGITYDPAEDNRNNRYLGSAASAWGYDASSGVLYNNGGAVYTTSTATTGDIIGVAMDLQNSKLYFSINNTWQNSGVPTSGATGTGAASITAGETYAFGVSDGSASHSTTTIVNFGSDSSFAGTLTAQGNQDSNDKGDFYYEPPTDYLALCTDNLSDPEIALPGEYFNTVLYASDNTNNRAITGVGFQPDFLWVKRRDSTSSNMVYDAIRGASDAETPRLVTNTNAAETLSTDEVDSFDSDGFTIDTGINGTGQTWVTWNWKAGGAPTADNSAGVGAVPTAGSVKIDGSNLGSALAGSIAATRLSANTTSGFSMVKYVGTLANATIAHGLSQAPDLMIVKSLDTLEQWNVYAEPISSTPAEDYLELSTTNALNTNDTFWNDTVPSASVFTVGTYSGTNGSTDNLMAYCFHSVEGYSKVGSYTGNNDADGVFVYTGFKPAFVLIKEIGVSRDWVMFDDKRSSYNEVTRKLSPNDNGPEGTARNLDFLSNGIKMRESSAYINDALAYLYIAFSSHPFKYSNAR